jgi:hypothetical protein
VVGRCLCVVSLCRGQPRHLPPHQLAHASVQPPLSTLCSLNLQELRGSCLDELEAIEADLDTEEREDTELRWGGGAERVDGWDGWGGGSVEGAHTSTLRCKFALASCEQQLQRIISQFSRVHCCARRCAALRYCRRTHYGPRWKRPPSSQLAKTMRDKIGGYRGNLMQVGGRPGGGAGGWWE